MKGTQDRKIYNHAHSLILSLTMSCVDIRCFSAALALPVEAILQATPYRLKARRRKERERCTRRQNQGAGEGSR